MKKITLLFLLLCAAALPGFAQELSYYLPDSLTYSPEIPKPSEIIGHRVGERHVTHDRLVLYMNEIARISDRITIEKTGETYEGRPLFLLTITAPENRADLDKNREKHLALSRGENPAGAENLPAVVWTGFSIHGNEPSGSNAALAAIYYLAAAQGPQIDDLLKNTVILFDPSYNPDGLDRFAGWVNSRKNFTENPDPETEELNEPWPGGRTNHYWFDLNRDWLPAQLPESQARLKQFQRWLPHILTDHHEMGSNSSFFFQPGIPSRVNPNTPLENQKMTDRIGRFHAAFLDRIGSLYYTREDYDDFYYGKGSTYPDAMGSIGILFEQASSRGHLRETENGLLTFPFTIRNQFTTFLSTLEAAKSLHPDLIKYRRDFAKNAAAEAGRDPVKGYAIGSPDDPARLRHFGELLVRHKIEFYETGKDVQVGKTTFGKGKAYFIPAGQPAYKLLKGMFQTETKFTDSLFYDISAWTLPYAFGLDFAELSVREIAGFERNTKITEIPAPKGDLVGGPSDYAYLFGWEDHYAPRALYYLQNQGFITKVAAEPAEIMTAEGLKKFRAGSILVTARNGAKSPVETAAAVRAAAELAGIRIFAVKTGLTENGIDLGSRLFSTLRKPKILLVVGEGVSSYDAGEIWHLLDRRFQIPVTLAATERLDELDLQQYTSVILPHGNYGSFPTVARKNLTEFVRSGGNVTALRGAFQLTKSLGLHKFTEIKDAARDSSLVLPYAGRSDDSGAKEIGGAIFNARADLTHPLCFGYSDENMKVFKDGSLFMKKSNNPYASPLIFTENPLAAGYLHASDRKRAAGASALNVQAFGQGKTFVFSDNPNFRAFWYGTEKLFLNTLFFGETVSGASAR